MSTSSNSRFTQEPRIPPKTVVLDRPVPDVSKGAKGIYSHGRRKTLLRSVVDNGSELPNSWTGSCTSYEESFSPLSASISSNSRPKRKIKLDLGSQHGQRSEDRPMDFGLSEFEATPVPNIRSKKDLSLLPRSFGKKRVRSPTKRHKLSQNHPMYSAGAGKRDPAKGLPKLVPFDICHTNIDRSAASDMLNASLHAKNEEMQVPIEQSKERAGHVLRPGMVLLKSYITLAEQVQIVKTCRELGVCQGGFYQPGYRDGAKLRLQMMCLGLDWDPETRKYTNERAVDGSETRAIPCEFRSLVNRAIQDSHALIQKKVRVSNVEDLLPYMTPDICIVNFYTTSGRLGLHQDRDETKDSIGKGLPVVSFSIGDSAEFLNGEQRDVDKAHKVRLESGDVLIFGGDSRLVFHGVPSIIPDSAPPALLEESNLQPGRLNLTFRQY